MRKLTFFQALNEHLTHDYEIEHRLDNQEEGTQNSWHDMLEFIQDAGPKGLSRQDLAAQMLRLYPHIDVDEMMNVVGWRFDNVVEMNRERNWFRWIGRGYPTAKDIGTRDGF